MSAHAEHTPIDAVIQRLTERFPTVPPERVAAVVHEELQQFEDARVTDFVPVLVEHEAHDVLRRAADPAPLTDDGAAAVVQGPDAEGSPDPLEVERGREHTGLLLGDLDN
jgi:hypothetical protein